MGDDPPPSADSSNGASPAPAGPQRGAEQHRGYSRSFWCRPATIAWALNVITLGAAAVALLSLHYLRNSIDSQNSLLDLSTRAVLTSDLKNWRINPTALTAGASPTVAFEIKNDGHNQYAHIFNATYESTFSAKPPIRFGAIKRIPDFPALLGPDIDFPIIISGLPSVPADQMPIFDSGRTFLWLRTIFEYRDDQGIVFQVRFTGRYGRGINEKGVPDFRFSFPDNDVPRDRWHSFGSDGVRCLNTDKSETQDLGCGDPQ